MVSRGERVASPGGSEGLGRSARLTVAAASLVAVGAYVAVAVQRMDFPYELQWIEGGILEATRRFMDGSPLYVAPGVDFTSYPYPPLYMWAGAGLGRVANLDLNLLRGLSFVASLATMVALFAWVFAETRRWEAGVASAGLYAASFGVTGAWFDLARVDSLFMFFLVVALISARFARRHITAVVAGLLFTAAFLTKQSTILVALPVLGYMVLRRPHTVGLAGSLAFVLPVAATTLALDAGSDEWYRFFLFRSLANHGLVTDQLDRVLTDELAPAAVALGVVLVGMVVAAATVSRSRSRPGRAPIRLPKRGIPVGFYLVAVTALVGAALAGRLHSGGFLNNLIPAYAGLAVAFGVALGWLAAWRSYWWWQLAVVVAAIGSLLPLRWDPGPQIPDELSTQAGDTLVSAIADIDGEVWVVSHPALATAAGKAPLAHAAAMGDILRGDDADLTGDLSAEIAAAVRQQRFAAIVFDVTSLDRRGFPDDLDRYYRNIGDPFFGEDPFSGPDVGRPVTDRGHRPTEWWLRR